MPLDLASELFDVCDAEGAPLGVQKPRGLVHRDGDWHRSMHLWIVLARGSDGANANAPWVLFQRRASTKDTWPNAVDVAVAGHYRAGEGLAEVLREAEEEISWVVRPEDVRRLGVRMRDDDHVPGVRDREVQDILLAVTERSLTSFTPDPTEVSELVAVPLLEAERLARGNAIATCAALREARIISAEIASRELVGAPDGYYEIALRAIRARLNGEAPPPFRIKR
jgi:isopentenyldiphosphate isomerase